MEFDYFPKLSIFLIGVGAESEHMHEGLGGKYVPKICTKEATEKI